MSEWIDTGRKVFVRCNSHRSREKLTRLLGYYPPEYYCLLPSNKPGCLFNAPHFWLIPADKLEKAKEITGITKARINPDWKLMECI